MCPCIPGVHCSSAPGKAGEGGGLLGRQSGIGSAEIQGRGIITAGAARRLACDYGIIPAVLGGVSQILDLGTPQRLATPTQRRNLALRDGGCLFPGCERPPAVCEAHHRKHRIEAARPPSTTWIFSAFSITTWCMKAGPTEDHRRHDADVLSARRGRASRAKRPLLQNDDLNLRLDPEPTVRINKPRRTRDRC